MTEKEQHVRMFEYFVFTLINETFIQAWLNQNSG